MSEATFYVRTTQELRDAAASGWDARKSIEIDPDMIAEHAQAITDATTARADAAQARADLLAGQQKWDAERATLVAAALAMEFPAQTDAIVAAERERIAGLLAMQKRGFEALTHEAIAEGLSLEAFALKQLRAERDRGVTLDQIERDSPAPAAHAAPPATESGKRAGLSWGAVWPKGDAAKQRM